MARASETEQLFDELSAFNRKLRAFFDAVVRERGLTLARTRTLFALARRGPLTQRELAEELEIETPTLVRVLDGMEKQELIQRQEDETDRRAKRIDMTPAGRVAYEDVYALARDLRQQISEDISTEDILLTLSVVRCLMDNMQRLDVEKVRS
jgi:Transcriptional regulators